MSYSTPFAAVNGLLGSGELEGEGSSWNAVNMLHSEHDHNSFDTIPSGSRHEVYGPSSLAGVTSPQNVCTQSSASQRPSRRTRSRFTTVQRPIREILCSTQAQNFGSRASNPETLPILISSGSDRGPGLFSNLTSQPFQRAVESSSSSPPSDFSVTNPPASAVQEHRIRPSTRSRSSSVPVSRDSPSSPDPHSSDLSTFSPLNSHSLASHGSNMRRSSRRRGLIPRSDNVTSLAARERRPQADSVTYHFQNSSLYSPVLSQSQNRVNPFSPTGLGRAVQEVIEIGDESDGEIDPVWLDTLAGSRGTEETGLFEDIRSQLYGPDANSEALAYDADRTIEGLISLSRNGIHVRRQTLADDRLKRQTVDRAGLKDIMLSSKAVCALQYTVEPSKPDASDVWPEIRIPGKLPTRYSPIPLSRGHSIRPTFLKRCRIHQTSEPTNPLGGWLAGALPTELFEMITSYLCRDDIKAMRLVNKEFERHVSKVLFNAVVVPFNTEIFGMLVAPRMKNPDFKGKKKAVGDFPSEIYPQTVSWQNANADDVYEGHGMEVFEGFGPHIQKFGMSFEVDEESLARPPFKGVYDGCTSYWGKYNWPYEHYQRYNDVAGLEYTADETPKMKTAFSKLTKVKELALSMNSGLGWLCGPDTSLHSKIFRHFTSVFGSSYNNPDRKVQAQRQLWSYIQQAYRSRGISADIRTAMLFRHESNNSMSDSIQPVQTLASPAVLAQPSFPFMDSRLIAEAIPDEVRYTTVKREQRPVALDDIDVVERFISSIRAPATNGILYTSSEPASDNAHIRCGIVPRCLSTAQKEWLLETEWAQRAFLSSYMLAIIDNGPIFQQVHTLNLAGISSRYLAALCRSDFWDALEGLRTVKVEVIPEWRTVVKDEAGFVSTPTIEPSSAAASFTTLIQEIICPKANITNLTIGWAAGGERAAGLHARNRHLLPAPFQSPRHHNNDSAFEFLQFKHVEHLTLKNCWVTPSTLVAFVASHQEVKLRRLTLNSVSLVTVPPQVGNQAQSNGNWVNLGNQMFGWVPVQPAQFAIIHGIQLAQHNGPGAQAPPPFPNPPVSQTDSSPLAALSFAHSNTSWPFVINKISPGKHFRDLIPSLPNPLPNEDSEIPCSTELEFISCGYARLQNNADEAATVNTQLFQLPFFNKRYNALYPAMMLAKDPLFADIIQHIPQVELIAMDAAWGLVEGWENEFEAEGPTFDGLLPGGTGRFSGVIRCQNQTAEP